MAQPGCNYVEAQNTRLHLMKMRSNYGILSEIIKKPNYKDRLRIYYENYSFKNAKCLISIADNDYSNLDNLLIEKFTSNLKI